MDRIKGTKAVWRSVVCQIDEVVLRRVRLLLGWSWVSVTTSGFNFRCEKFLLPYQVPTQLTNIAPRRKT